MRKLFIIGVGFLSTLLIVATVYSGEKLAHKLYLKSGTVIECDIFWEDRGDFILIQKSHGTIGYWKSEVDLIRTFGQSSATEIAKRYEERLKHRELISRPRIVTPEQERSMKKQERERRRREIEELSKKYFWTDKYGKKHIVTKELIELEKRRLEDKLPRRSSEGKTSIRNKIKELERDPAMYFYKKSQKPPAPIVIPPIIVHTW